MQLPLCWGDREVPSSLLMPATLWVSHALCGLGAILVVLCIWWWLWISLVTRWDLALALALAIPLVRGGSRRWGRARPSSSPKTPAPRVARVTPTSPRETSATRWVVGWLTPTCGVTPPCLTVTRSWSSSRYIPVACVGRAR